MMRRLLSLSAAGAAVLALASFDIAVPVGMVKIPGGTFEYGTDTAALVALMAQYHVSDPSVLGPEAPQRTVTLKPFYLDKGDVTVADFVRFVVKDTAWLPKGDSAKFSNGDYLSMWAKGRVVAGSDSIPVTWVTWFSARAYCRFMGRRLPTEVEWEYAARGGANGGDIFPWGDAPADTTRANYGASGIGHPTRAGIYAANGYGLYDMAGNVWQFTADQWSDPRDPPPAKGPVVLAPWSKDPSIDLLTRVVIRGGSYDGAPVNMRVRYRDSHPAGGAKPFVGFRCAKDG